MAKNPFFSNKTSPNGATAPNDPLNSSHKRYFRGYNKFNLTRQLYTTERYADINLIEVLNGVEGDKLPFGNKHFMRSYTMQTPIMFDIYKKKTYFCVNNQAILPINWKKVYKQPNKGDDVAWNVNCVSQFLEYFVHITNNMRDNNSFLVDSNIKFTNALKFILLFESVFSNGSLLANMNCHLSPMVKCESEVDDSTLSVDSFLDNLYSRLFTNGILVNYLNNTIYIGGTSTKALSVHQGLELLRMNMNWNVLNSDSDTWSILNSALKQIRIYFDDSLEDEDTVINLERLIAYQLVCAQFYTRDSVDNIYTAPDYLDNAKSIYLSLRPSSPFPNFSYNGTKYDYDVFSGYIIDEVFRFLTGYFNSNANANISDAEGCFNFLHLIFFHRKSLRYGDYFVGGKTLPYAPMDVTADVVGNGVSALDMTRSIIAQRFANLVERAHNTWKDYLNEVTGGTAVPTPFEPRFLANSTSSVTGFEVENTGSEQFDNQSVTTILKSGNSNYMYEVEVSEPCIIIGVSTYEIPRVYSKTLSRFFKMYDRFTMFNKSFQNIGDQEITNNERNSRLSPLSTFAYTPRHMEYKQRYPIAAGGFVENLKGWSFIADNDSDTYNLDNVDKLSSFYLRSKNYEFDRFYKSLTGYSLASYFHFIVKYDLICHASRQMEYSPDIL